MTSTVSQAVRYVSLAQAWWRLSAEERVRIANIAPRLAELLEEADRDTRGYETRCVCTSAPHHDPRCPGRAP